MGVAPAGQPHVMLCLVLCCLMPSSLRMHILIRRQLRHAACRALPYVVVFNPSGERIAGMSSSFKRMAQVSLCIILSLAVFFMLLHMLKAP